MPRVSPGDDFRKSLTAPVLNRVLSATDIVHSEKFNSVFQAADYDFAPSIARVRNDSGAAISQFGVIGLGAPIITPTDNLPEFKRQVTFIGAAPDDVTHRGKVGVYLLPCGDGKIAPALVSGVVQCKVHINDVDHKFADVLDGSSVKLNSAAGGAAQILWQESGTGEKWAIVRLGPSVSGGFVGKTTGTITARSGTTAGSGTFERYYLASGVLTATGEVYTVYNFAASSVASGKYGAVTIDRNGDIWLDSPEC